MAKLKNEWLQGIVGSSLTAEMDEKVAQYLGQNFVTKSDFNQKNTEFQTLRQENEQLRTAASGAEGMQQRLQALEGSLAQAKAESFLAVHKPKNMDLFKTALGVDKLQLDAQGNLPGDFSTKVESFVKENPYMFEAGQGTEPESQQKQKQQEAGDKSLEDALMRDFGSFVPGGQAPAQAGGGSDNPDDINQMMNNLIRSYGKSGRYDIEGDE